jgi:hypothetical protein
MGTTSSLDGANATPPCTQTATLRNLPATIVVVLDLKAGSPFPRESLARLWNVSFPDEAPSDQAISEVAPAGPVDPNQLRLPFFQDLIESLADGDWVLIRQNGETYEQLSKIRQDPKQVHNRARDPQRSAGCGKCGRRYPRGYPGVAQKRSGVNAGIHPWSVCADRIIGPFQPPPRSDNCARPVRVRIPRSVCGALTDVQGDGMTA